METNLMELRRFLRQELLVKQKLNESYSQRAFARDLGLSPTTLNEFLCGHRDLNLKNIDKVFSYFKTKSEICCSWCGKPKQEAELMIKGPRRQFICKSCVNVCNDIIEEGRIATV